MATDQEIAEAIEKAKEEGARQERERLRAFTGIPYHVMPNDSLPEHESYLAYEAALQDEIEDCQRRLESSLASAGAVDEWVDRAITAHTDALLQHQDVHEKNVFLRIKGRLTEIWLPEKKDLDTAEKKQQQHLAEVARREDLLPILRAEKRRVGQWLDAMYSSTATAGQARETERLHAQRDITSRGFAVYGMKDYLEEDPGRQLRWGPVAPGGMDFGYHWRRDGDDDFREGPQRGRWRCVWFGESQETAVWISEKNRPEEVWLLGTHIQTQDEAMAFFVPLEAQQKERNSLAVLMDAYTETYINRPASPTPGRRKTPDRDN